jgi:hypothetical protein
MIARTPMITETNRANLIGATVVDEIGETGTIIRIDLTTNSLGKEDFAIVVNFGDGWICDYSSDGYLYFSYDACYIKLV